MDFRSVLTTCPYCGVGCNFIFQVMDGRIIATLPAKTGPANEGSLCIKGWNVHEFVQHKDRLTKPLLRQGGSLQETTWDQAFDYAASELNRLKETYGPESVAFAGSARCPNEDTYVFQKFARVIFGHNHVDHCARLCHAPTVAGLASAFGSGAMTNSFAELAHAKCVFVIGSNTTVSHPIAGMYLMRVRGNGGRLIVADPRKTQIAQLANLHVQQNLGTDVALINGLMHVIYKNGWHNQAFIESRTENFPALVEMIEPFTPERTEAITGVAAADILKIAEWYAKSETSAIVYVLGITQHTTGTDNVKSLANLAMLCGQVGRPSTGVNPIRGQNNVQGACDMGALPNVLPGYQYVTVPENVEKFEKAWNAKLSGTPGLTMVEQIEAVHQGKVKGLVVFGANPAVSYPDSNRVQTALEKLEFLLVMDIFPTPTTAFAHVVLPAASFAETEGTFSNSERRVQRVRQAIAPIPGKTNWETLQELCTRMGYPMAYGSAEEIFNEMASLTPAYGGMSFPRLNEKGLCWPCPTPDHPGTRYLHQDRFTRGKGLFQAIDYRPPAETPDAEYPFWLTTGQLFSQYLTGTMTRRCPTLHHENPEVFIEIHPEDADRLHIDTGEKITTSSRRGSITAKAWVTERVRPGVVFIPMHFMENAANRLTNAALDPVTKTPEYKVCAVNLGKAA
ncbi:MAG: formate dehydrogenase subunit alpha [Syntrophobacterales bacterium]|nr:formate dehydrogenase subunit alpha [Syntrophobacterales bacterium]